MGNDGCLSPVRCRILIEEVKEGRREMACLLATDGCNLHDTSITSTEHAPCAPHSQTHDILVGRAACSSSKQARAK